ncbi:MAG: threonine/serine exporter family protein [Oscillospiraceae bacterium]|nr:threonine/serine exporter family protein [Oscillospiraceae bacterium]MDD4367680.1 threonine/serine exporter family protein [Oscillospiraceae bacterium]
MIIGIAAAAVVTVAFSIIFQVNKSHMPFAALNGALGYAIYLLLLPVNIYAGILAGSAAIALAGELMARWRRAPATLFLVAPLIPLVPGGDIYQSLLMLLTNNLSQTAHYLYLTLMKSGSIALGIIFVSSAFVLVRNFHARRRQLWQAGRKPIPSQPGRNKPQPKP